MSKRTRTVRFALMTLLLTFVVTSAWARTLTITHPNNGEWYEPGQTIVIQWISSGSDWQAGDTIRLEYSTSAGARWDRVIGASDLPYDTGFFAWDTTDYPQSEQCMLRVTYNGDDQVTDTSDNAFAVAVDNVPPVIHYTPESETANVFDPYPVYARITDNYGVASATLYWSKNGSEFAAVAMTPTGSEYYPNQYRADIPGPSFIGDVFNYYIEVQDSSTGANVARHPQSAPSEVNVLRIVECGTETFSNTPGTQLGTSLSNYSCGNIFKCTVDCELTLIEQHLKVESSTEIRFLVYESSAWNGNLYTYSLIHETILSNPVVGDDFYSSGPISVKMTPGRSYCVMTAWQGACWPRWQEWGLPTTTSFGDFLGAYKLAGYPPPATIAPALLGAVHRQRLTTCRVPRALNVIAPNEGRIFEVGSTVEIRWKTQGVNWHAGDTVRLEYSTDGVTWNPISGAQQLPYNATSFVGDTTGCAASDFIPRQDNL